MTWDEFLSERPLFCVRFWADGEPLGELKFKDEPFGQTMSEFFYCHVCNKVWGMIEYPNRHWLPAHITCRWHKDARSKYRIPGSMLGPVDDLDNYPEPFLRRELEVHLDFFEKETGNEPNEAN